MAKDITKHITCSMTSQRSKTGMEHENFLLCYYMEYSLSSRKSSISLHLLETSQLEYSLHRKRNIDYFFGFVTSFTLL